MKRKLLGLGMVAAMFIASSALAAPGINLSWTDCYGDAPLSNKTFACASNSGSNIMTTSFILPQDMPQTSGNELVLDILTTSTTIPPWWEFRNAGSCRLSALASNTSINPNDVNCVDWAAGQSAGGIGAYSTELGSVDAGLTNQHRRIKIAIAIPLPLVDLVMDQEYFSCNLTINNTKTTGLGACAGCSEAVCIVFNSINITRPVGVGDLKISNPTQAGSNIITWQGTGPNCQLVPTRNVTWGSVKSLYR